jgi:hypothetical protein
MTAKTETPGMSRKIVIAGNYRQYLQWMRANHYGPNEAIYADSEDKILGLEFSESDVIYTGEYWRSPITEAFLRTRYKSKR